MKAAYFESNGKYLVVKENGTSVSLSSKEEFDKYVKANNLEIEK